ncbi:MAG: Uma2 family endonuclease [Myxococcales bacterium]|nr:Uma2 family endonuclease [Myxococcales bacterium]
MSSSLRDQLRYVRPITPVLFPESDPEWDLGQNTLHFDVCALLRRILLAAVGEHGTVGADQFLYFDASSPRRKCAPDAFVKLGPRVTRFPSWKTWEGGVPELCVEVQSPAEMEKLTLEEKLARYHEIGVDEVLVYDPELPPGGRVRAWDRVEGDLVERVVEGERTPCVTLGLYWVLVRDDEIDGDALRLAEDAAGDRLVLTAGEARAEEARVRAEEARVRADGERARAEGERARADEAAREVARLRAEIDRLRGG